MKKKKPIMYYVCYRNAQCGKPCDQSCFYTTDFRKSKLFHSPIKLAGLIRFLKRYDGNFIEYDESLVNVLKTVVPETTDIWALAYRDVENMASNGSIKIIGGKKP